MTRQPIVMSGGFFDRLDQLSSGEPFLFWLPIVLASAAAVVAVVFAQDILREGRERRRREAREMARKLQLALDARYAARCANSVRVALREGRGISEGLHDEELPERIRCHSRRR